MSNANSHVNMAYNEKLLLVFTDSRGKNLDVYLEHPNVLIKAFSGATLHGIISRAESTILNLKPAGVLFIGGTCDLTTLDRATRTLSLRHDIIGDLLEHMIDVFRTARNTVNEKFPETKVAFGGLCGIDLDRYNGRATFSPLQPIVDDTIHLLNYHIKTDNIQHGLVHPTLTSRVHIVRSNRPRRNQYRLLIDGIHLSETIYTDWAKNIIRFYDNNF